MSVLSLPSPPAEEPQPRGVRAVSDFTALSQQIHAAGFMRRRYGYYWTKLIALAAALVGTIFAVVEIGDSWWQLVAAAVLAFVLTQLAFLGHDAAHRQIFRSGKWNDWVSLVVANLLVGISYGWWRNKHTKHHANPNKVDHDPDIHLKAVAFTPAQARRHRNPLISWLVAHQGWWFFPILLLEGLQLHTAGIRRVLSREKVERRWVEATFLAIRIGGYLAIVFAVLPPGKAAAFLGVQVGLFGLYLGSAFAPNHIGMPLVSPQLKLDFLRRQVLMSRNISGGRAMDVFMGGLNHQVEHHLFPSMARPQLRHARPLVAAYCSAQQLPYTQTTLWQSYGVVIRYLNTVGLRNRDPFLCPLVADRRQL
ncbi:MAG: acyl-CoA desaturase [Propionibacteriaceae bacterium]